MYLVLIAWIYVAFMMAIAEATSPVGSLLGAAFTFLLYGVLPMSVVGYIMGTPARRRVIKAKEAAEREATRVANEQPNTGDNVNSVTPNAHSEASGDAVAPVRKEP
jgi:membrane protein implicated in regulation of membrane protease activity